MREVRLPSGKDHLVHECHRVVLRGLRDVGTEHEALALREDHAFHRGVGYGELAEQVRKT